MFRQQGHSMAYRPRLLKRAGFEESGFSGKETVQGKAGFDEKKPVLFSGKRSYAGKPGRQVSHANGCATPVMGKDGKKRGESGFLPCKQPSRQEKESPGRSLRAENRLVWQDIRKGY
ncbi:hypothetical protein [Oxalobacter paraformigenes]|uniref:hypothetical protein n=2 Tax=Oxalobacter paraformigenes TaxID=556268 RepID=UPI000315E733|nr:hypothetical protein [Oxalobacter paraformigenes]